jgi:hypothetical protein
MGSKPDPVKLSEFMDDVSDHVRQQVFAGTATRDRTTRDILVMTTVLSKFNGSPSLGALQQKDIDCLKQLVTPRGRPSDKPLSEHVWYITREHTPKETNYLIFDNMARFTWSEELLQPVERNHQHLNCYHNNNFFSLMQAWHFEGLLRAANGLKSTPALDELVKTARVRLSSPKRKNASLLVFTHGEAVKEILSAWDEKDKAKK